MIFKVDNIRISKNISRINDFGKGELLLWVAPFGA